MFTLCHVIHLIIHNIQKNIITKKSNVTSLALFLFVKTDQSQINSIVVYPPNDNINRRKSCEKKMWLVPEIEIPKCQGVIGLIAYIHC